MIIEDNTVYFEGIEPGQSKTQANGIIVHRSKCGNHFTWNQDGAACSLTLNKFFTKLNRSPNHREIAEARSDENKKMSKDKIVLFDVIDPGEARILVDGTVVRRSEYDETYEQLKDGLWTDISQEQLIFACSKHPPELVDKVKEEIAGLKINTACYKWPLLSISIYDRHVLLDEEDAQKVIETLNKWLTSVSNAKKEICRGIY